MAALVVAFGVALLAGIAALLIQKTGVIPPPH